MELYGHILENGRLEVYAITEKKEVLCEEGRFVERVVTIEEQIAELSSIGWKPVDEQDEATISDHKENEKVIPIPHDNGSRIIYTYEKIIDKVAIQRKIDSLAKEVAATDYQVRKCQEYSLVGKAMPYDIQAIHVEAEKIREKIRKLEKLIS